MSSKTLSDISADMRHLDFSMLMTHTEGGAIAGRPMSNNQDVDYSGDSFFFCFESARTVRDIERNPKVTLAYSGAKGFLINRPYFVNVEGVATLIRDKAAFAEHWTKDLDTYFGEKGIDTPGLLIIKVSATRIHYWDGEEEGEVPL